MRRLGASTLVADFSPLRPVREALDAVVSDMRRDAAGVAVHQVIVSLQIANGILEFQQSWDLLGVISSETFERFVVFTQVDAHNVVPVWAASEKLQYSAKTFRSKVNKVIDEYLVEFPELPAVQPWDGEQPEEVDWDALIDRVCRYGESYVMNLLKNLCHVYNLL